MRNEAVLFDHKQTLIGVDSGKDLVGIWIGWGSHLYKLRRHTT
jgi:hypothetical protein